MTDINEFFEPANKSRSGGGGSRIDPAVFERIAEMASKALKKLPEGYNSVAVTLEKWNHLTGQNRSSCAGLLDRANSYYEAMQKAWQKYGVKAVASRPEKKIYFFRVAGEEGKHHRP